MEQNYHKAFIKALGEALDKYYPNWDLRHQWDYQGVEPHEDAPLVVWSDTLKRWQTGESFPRRKNFDEFLRKAALPPDVKQNLKAHYEKASQQRRKNNRSDRTEEIVEDIIDEEEDVEIIPASPKIALPAEDNIPFWKTLFITHRLIFGVAGLLVLVLLCGLPFILEAANSTEENNPEEKSNPRIVNYGNSWCSAIPTSVGYFTSSDSSSQQPRLYFDKEADVGDFDKNKYYIFFCSSDELGAGKDCREERKNKAEYVPIESIGLRGLDRTKNEWLFVIEDQWITQHPEWQTPTLWRVDYACKP